eukprot:GHVN01034570.1.p1 GENE.GHVN01034570.1~~GHVN01034570.1.p1  ORF type:complete len:267 (+),score=24.36 GHVN01034570.1:181-981(+)
MASKDLIVKGSFAVCVVGLYCLLHTACAQSKDEVCDAFPIIDSWCDVKHHEAVTNKILSDNALVGIRPAELQFARHFRENTKLETIGNESWVFWSLVAVGVSSVVSFACGFALTIYPKIVDTHLTHLLAFGAGTMMADFFLHIFPHALSSAHSSHSHSSPITPTSSVIADNHHATASVEGLCLTTMAGVMLSHIIDLSLNILQSKVKKAVVSVDQPGQSASAATPGRGFPFHQFLQTCTTIRPIAAVSLACDFIHNCRFVLHFIRH